MTRTGYKKFRRAPLLKRYRRHELTLNRVFLPAISLHHRFINKVNFSHAVLVGADFSNSVVLNCSFYEAYLRGADFGGALLKSSKVGKTFSGWRMKSPTTFVTAQLQDVDFREAEFFKTMMSGADMTRAKMYGASIVVDDTWDWKDTNWWKADYDRGESATLDSAAANLTTNDSLRLLYSQHGEHVPTDANEVHSSVREFSRAQQVDVKQ